MISSHSHDTHARHAMAATTHPEAAQAGIDIMRAGGNAVDAAIAMAAMMTVVEPTSNGLGGDCFAIVKTPKGIFGLNSSGPAPSLLTLDGLNQKGHQKMPRFGFDPVTVPGAVKGWQALHKRFGDIPFGDVIKPAIEAARKGFVVSPVIAKNWDNALKIYQKHLQGPMFNAWFETFAKHGEAPSPGEIMTLVDHASTLEKIADTYGDAFYHGDLADQIDSFSKTYGGWIRKEDLLAYEPEWVTPLSITYRGVKVYELPPNGQGIVALSALRMLENYDIATVSEDHRIHLQIEALKLAFADAFEYVTDPAFENVPVTSMLNHDYLSKRSKHIKDNANTYTSGRLDDHGTVYLATGDPKGMMVSFIQSNYMGFGSGLVVPNTGISLNNRGMNFSMDVDQKNALKPGKRPYHTIIPGFVEHYGTSLGPFGIMGGFMQPQAHVQVLSHLIDGGLSLQEALDAYRFQWLKGFEVQIEAACPQNVIKHLEKRGHKMFPTTDVSPFGRGQIILRDTLTKTYRGATERRADGHIALW